jgi:NitT/TauT family transport system substrate-binding protein
MLRRARGIARAPHRRRALTALAAAALAVPLAACGVLGGSSGTGSTTANANQGALEKSTVKLSLVPVIDVAPVYIAQAKGYFAREGLTVQTTNANGGNDAIPSLVGGDVDVLFSNYVSLFSAEQAGAARLKLIADGYQAGPNTFILEVKGDSPIKRPSDLDGKSVALNTLNGIGELLTKSALTTAGADVNSIKFTPIPFPNMAAALDRDQVQAAWVSEPYITQAARQIGAVPLVDTASGPTADSPIGGYAVTEQFAKSNPRTVAAFQRAMSAAAKDATDRREVEAVLPTYANLNKETVSLLNFGVYPVALTPSRLQRVADLMLTNSFLKAKLDVAPMVVDAG